MSTEQTCTTCGGQIFAGDRFCAHCGAEQASFVGAPEKTGGRSPWDPVLQRLRDATAEKYEIGRVLGTGGMAAVYLGREVRLNRPVAIKVMSPGLMMAPGMVDRFQQEAVTVAALNHPNIVTIYTVEETQDLHYFVMKYFSGPSLETVIRRDGPLPKSVVKAWLTQVSSALGYAHRQGVVHRDIKPANILLDDEGNAVVTDFGIAKVPRRSNLTQTGMTLGTPAYMSPEQCTSKEITAASDQYSLGVVAYEMLTGEPPFTGPSLEVMKAHTERPPRPITVHRPHCPAELVAAVDRMLEKDPLRRWAAMEDIIATIGGTPIAHDDPIRAQLAALASPSAQRARLRTTGVGGGPAPSPPRGQAAISPPAGQQAITPPSEQDVLPAYLVPEPAPVPAVPAEPAAVESLVLSPVPRSMWAGHSVQLQASILDAAGSRLEDRRISWESSDSEVAHVTLDGLVTSLKPGSATITAACEGQADRVFLEVMPVTVQSVRVWPMRRIMAEGSSVQFKAKIRGSDGSSLTDRPIDWMSGDPEVIEVSADGLVTAVATGHAEVIARCEEQAKAAPVRVTQPGAAYLVGRFWWTAPLAAVALLTLWLGLRSPTEELPPRVTSVVIQPPAASISIGGTANLNAVLRDEAGNVLTERSVIWESNDISVASVAGGIVTGEGPGTATITAREEGGMQATATVTVGLAHVRVASVTVQPESPTIIIGNSVTLRARMLDGEGADLAGRTVTWESSDPSIARVSLDGTVTGQAEGSTRITATSEGRSASTVVSVSTLRVDRVTIQAARRSLTVGGTLRLSARAIDQRGNALPGRTPRWRSSSTSIATVSGNGTVRGHAEGRTVITATVEGRSATVSLTVNPAGVASVTVSLERNTVTVDDAVRATAQAAGADGTVLTGREVTWSVGDPSVARVSQAGVVTALSAGTTSIMASIDGVRGSAALAVSAREQPRRRPEEELGELVERFRSLFELEDLDGMGSELYRTAVPRDDANLMGSIFDRAEDLRVDLVGPPRFEIVEGRATADIELHMEFIQTRSRDPRQMNQRFRLTFTEDQAGWRLQNAEARR
jgi:serine/threonine-protein kinase